SRATLEQMEEAADLLADPKRQPVFFHCVAGHHRTNLAHAAYLIRHHGYSAERAWRAVASLPWSRPDADEDDWRLIEAFAARCRTPGPQRKDAQDDAGPEAPGRTLGRRALIHPDRVHRREVGDG
ncbi:MAG: dual specificity protein phosphatase family protein, partial [Isosphaeraceae bacterium]|nr:dual specificity protein phosphatase family protein [Isosphaeraceae bacterium]